jgi:serine/threonine protein kinase
MSTRPLTQGETLGGRYTLRVASWTSALGPVWEARDTVLNRTVWVQLLTDDLARDPSIARRMQRNAAAIAQISHVAVTRIFDIGNDPPFIVFEHATRRLTDRLARGALRTNEAARAALALARGLEALHAAGQTHGSLGPTSVSLDDEGRPRILALGIAETLDGVPGVDPTAEQPEGYHPPEHAPPDVADRYALAALTHHMLHGRPPGGPAARRLVIPTGLSSLLHRALSQEPGQRPTLDRFISALAPFARVEPPRARRPRVVAAEFRWLVPAVVIVVLAAVALTFGGRYIADLARREPDVSPTQTQTFAAGDAIPITRVSDFDPHGDDGQENPEDVDRAIDGDPATSWGTLYYADRGFDKPGVGLLLDLGSVTAISAVRIQTELPGWTAEIRVGDGDGADEEAFDVVETFTADTETTVQLPANTSARYVLAWFTEGADRGAKKLPYHAEIAEIEVFA